MRNARMLTGALLAAGLGVRKFYDEVLRHGAIPFGLLDAKIRDRVGRRRRL